MTLIITIHDDQDGSTLGAEFLQWCRSIDFAKDPDPVADDGQQDERGDE